MEEIYGEFASSLGDRVKKRRRVNYAEDDDEYDDDDEDYYEPNHKRRRRGQSSDGSRSPSPDSKLRGMQFWKFKDKAADITCEQDAHFVPKKKTSKVWVHHGFSVDLEPNNVPVSQTGCSASYFFLPFGISPTFSYFSTKFLLFGSWRQKFLLIFCDFLEILQLFFDFVSGFLIFRLILKISENFYSIFRKCPYFVTGTHSPPPLTHSKMYLSCLSENVLIFLTFEPCSVTEIVNKAKSYIAAKFLFENSKFKVGWSYGKVEQNLWTPNILWNFNSKTLERSFVIKWYCRCSRWVFHNTMLNLFFPCVLLQIFTCFILL